ncbi:hypothetical protein NDN08_004865 [Rhodosorus marinus]|uniref:EGF-like domain-containing protein n=1 Tax=Rhodosorus marinus TaxID=101924 RepID=A0AAV8UHI9_9RHOD|nr:hypothetical protein NDN08_004865 [Rhodosorus marinus]
MMRVRISWVAQVIILIASCFAAQSCHDVLLEVDDPWLGVEGEVCRPLTRPNFSDDYDLSEFPLEFGTVCLHLDNNKLLMTFEMDQMDYLMKGAGYGIYSSESAVPSSARDAYNSKTFQELKKTWTVQMNLKNATNDCCENGIVVIWRAWIRPRRDSNTFPRYLFTYPATEDFSGGSCSKRSSSSVRICEMDVDCDTKDTCIRTVCPDTQGLVGPVDCSLVQQRVNRPCNHFGDEGTYQMGPVFTADCVCEPLEKPTTCVFNNCDSDGQPGCDEELYPGNACGNNGTVERVSHETDMCVCQVGSGVKCDSSDATGNFNIRAGNTCMSAAGSPGSAIELPDGGYYSDRAECSCTAPCEYVPDPVYQPLKVQKGYGGMACNVTVVGVSDSVPGVLREKSAGVCLCKPLVDINRRCSYSIVELDLTIADRTGNPYSTSISSYGGRGVLVPTDGEGNTCAITALIPCYCPEGENCSYAGAMPGDSCDNGSGVLLQSENQNWGCYCSSNGTDTGTCLSESQCYHPDAGCVDTGSSCWESYYNLAKATWGNSCECVPCVVQTSLRGEDYSQSLSEPGKCFQGLANGSVRVTNAVFYRGECLLDTCTRSSCEGSRCEEFTGVSDDSCDDNSGIIGVDARGNCRCFQECQNWDCSSGDCTPTLGTVARIGDRCTRDDGSGVLQPVSFSDDFNGQCQCAARTCSYSYIESLSGWDRPSATTNGNIGDTCHNAGQQGVVMEDPEDTSKCICYVEDKTCVVLEDCQTSTIDDLGQCDKWPTANVGRKCRTVTGIGEYALVEGSEGVCFCTEDSRR